VARRHVVVVHMACYGLDLHQAIVVAVILVEDCRQVLHAGVVMKIVVTCGTVVVPPVQGAQAFRPAVPGVAEPADWNYLDSNYLTSYILCSIDVR
jgi:hypothetical protein